MIVLDTNVLSEMMRPAPDEAVTRWLFGLPGASVYTTAVTEAEIRYGLALLPEGKRRAALEAAAEGMFEEDFAGRILPFDREAALSFARIAAARREIGRPIPHADAQIAAIARSRGATLATRHGADFEHCGIRVVNPWAV